MVRAPASGDPFEALGDPNRREILRLLSGGDKPVQEIAAATRIEIEHRGWERLGHAGQEWRDRNSAGWQALLPHFLAAIAKPGG